MTRKGNGRKKIAMKKMENESNLQVTFSKRRAGLFKKASELCTLCGAYIALIVFSPRNKVYSFGHPSVGTIIDKYLTNTNGDNNINSSGQNLTLLGLNMDTNNVEENLSIAKARAKQLNDLKKASEGRYWWSGQKKDKLTLEKLELLKAMMEELSNEVEITKHTVSVESEPVIDATTLIGPYGGTPYALSQDIPTFDPMVLDQSTDFGIPYEYKIGNEFGRDVPNSFTNDTNLIGGSHASLEPIVTDGVGPSGIRNTYYGSTNGYNRGMQ